MTVSDKARNRISDGEPYRNGEKKRRFADRLRPIDRRHRIGHVGKDVDVEVRRHISASGNLVGRRTMGLKVSRGIPYQFFGGQPALSLDKAPLDLPDVDGWIE